LSQNVTVGAERMAAKKSKSNSSKGGAGLAKKAASRKPRATARTKPASETAARAKQKAGAAQANAKPIVGARGAKNARNAPAPANNKQQPPEQAKRKPPSITITRPEAMRPPPVILPPAKVEAPIGAPNILIPKGGQPIASLTPDLRWMYVGGATRYEVEMSHDMHFGRGHGVTITSLQTAITLDPAHALKPGMDYQWRVRGGNDAGWGPWSPTESFHSPDKG
jgi:hypothetical protein